MGVENEQMTIKSITVGINCRFNAIYTVLCTGTVNTVQSLLMVLT